MSRGADRSRRLSPQQNPYMSRCPSWAGKCIGACLFLVQPSPSFPAPPFLFYLLKNYAPRFSFLNNALRTKEKAASIVLTISGWSAELFGLKLTTLLSRTTKNVD